VNTGGIELKQKYDATFITRTHKKTRKLAKDYFKSQGISISHYIREMINHRIGEKINGK
jgi:predicted HicB family RNase H-like nuclease